MTLTNQFCCAQPVSEVDVFSFALNLEYLEAQFYSFAAYVRPKP